MTYRKYSDFEQESVKFIVDEEASNLLNNPIYLPILLILREGDKTAEEIEEAYRTKKEYKLASVKSPSLKTIYRHLKALTDAGLVIQSGTKILHRTEGGKSTGSQKLFARTAKFFYLQSDQKYHLSTERIKVRAKLLSKVLQIGLEIPKPSLDCLEKLIEKIIKRQIASVSNLFSKHSDVMAEFLGDVPIDDLQSVVDLYSIINLLLSKDKFTKDFKECLKIT